MQRTTINTWLPVAALTGVGLVNGVEIGAEANLACAHLCDGRAYRSVYASVFGEDVFSRSNAVRCWMCETKMEPVPMNHVMTSFRRDYELIYTLMLSRISAFMNRRDSSGILAPASWAGT
ncbi:hypothetical protein ASPCAL00767 [Aspergillus calidoustus]|uniref:Uncharacterized protein n=1 Tax=Aspergillus calidoustus TaxID=454130 RepID=A0A0U5C1I3_ASPCI|nr:hypothetical protein ASPCAL00767 [Aspergillus calidoustus]